MSCDPGAPTPAARPPSTEHRLLDGTRVLVRAVSPDDKDELEAGFARLSPDSRYFRFFSHLDHLTPRQLAYLTEIDYDDHLALAAFALDEPGEPGIGVVRCVRSEQDGETAELAVAVLDDYHGRGLGVLLIRLLAAVAEAHGIARLEGFVLVDNVDMIDVFEFLGARLDTSEAGVLRAELDLPLDE